jgi:hypothetical protein
MTALVGFGKVVRNANNTLIEDIKRDVLGVAAGVQVDTVGHIAA